MSVEIKHASLTLGDKILLENFSAKFNTGELTIILGPNGTGKSSLLKLISREWQCNGQLRFYGKPSEAWKMSDLAQSVGILPQYSSLTFAFTVREVVELGGLALSASQAEVAEIATLKMQTTDVAHLADRLYPSLSGGEKQRVHLARVLTQLAKSPRDTVLMLDEPTSALDIGHQHKTLQLAKELAENGSAVIAVIHDLNLAAQYADRIIMLNNGNIVAQGSPSEVITPNNIEAVYGWPVSVIPHPDNAYPVVLA
ncbi:heme ABC transporter ATP-binding protein [Enterovibrio nigricans]|uniref:Iron complex transport system ATP-binding protein n=1 Tax=Enterovibrio nigricans DSM 22720 TaxID=1121868 RepID=A0A1T4V5I1_9GAMM|nr:heme ABC transporter ATP-binding protein [Enterovibrio nigricans]SKA60112.1 iron complex transport system ATP-binding protein [Enterovibrio nigricans DSM 22720]